MEALTVGKKSSRPTKPSSEEAGHAFRALFHNHPAPMWVYDLETLAFLEVNNAAIERYGYSRAEFLRMTVKDICPLEEGSRYDASAAQKHPARQPAGESRHLLKDGRIVDVEITSHALEFDGRNAALVVAQEITARKQADEANRQAEIPYRSLFEQTHDAVFVLDLQGRHLVANQRAADMLGYTLDEIQSLSVSDTSAQLTQSRQVIERLISGEHVPLFERIFRKKDGSLVPVEINVELVRDANGQPLHIQSMVRDISARKQADNSLRESEKRYRSLFENMFNGFAYCRMIFDGERPQDFIYLDVNKAFETLTGLKDVVGKKVSEVIPGIRESDPGLFEIYGRVALTGIAETFETYLEALKMWFSISVYSPEKEYFVAVFDVITARKGAEEKLRESEEHYRIVADFAYDWELWLLPGGSLAYVSPSCERITGYPAQAFIEDPGLLLKITHPEDQALYLSHLEDVNTHPEYQYMDYRILHRDGHVVWISHSCSAVSDADGRPFGRRVSNRDITDRKRAEESARQHGEQIKLLYEASQRLNRTLELDEIYQTVFTFLSAIVSSDNLIISAFDPETQLITCRAYWSDNGRLDVSSFPAIPLEPEGQGTQSIAIRTGQPLLINDYQAQVKTSRSSHYVDNETGAIVEELPSDAEITRSALIVPLKLGGKVTGAIQILSYQLNAYTADQLQLLEALALHIASAEQNALFYNRMQTELNERRQAEEALTASEGELRALFASMQDAVLVIDREGVYRKIGPTNPGKLYILPDELLGKSMSEIFTEEQARFFLDTLRRVLDTGQTTQIEYQLSFDEQAPWFEASISPMTADSTLWVARDVTERKQAEETLRSREAILEAVAFTAAKLLHAPDWTQSAVEVTQRLGRAAGVSRVYIFENHTGEDGVLLTSQRFEWADEGIAPQINNPDLQGIPLVEAGFLRWVDSLSRGEAIFGHVRDFPASERDLLAAQDILSMLVVPVFVEDAWWGFIGFDCCSAAREWSMPERDALQIAASLLGEAIRNARADQSLRESEERYRLMVDYSPYAIGVYQDGKLAFVNHASLSLMRAESPAELIGKPITSTVHPKKWKETRNRIKRMLQGETGLYPIEDQYKRLDGSDVPVQVTAAPFTFKGRPAIQVIALDITDRKQAEEALRQRLAELEALYRVSTALRTAQTFDEALSIMLDQTLLALETEAGMISIYHPAPDDLREAVAKGWFKELKTKPVKPGEGIAGHVFETGQAHHSNEFARDLQARPPAGGTIIPPGWGGACLPIRAGAETVGVLFVSVPMPRQITPEQFKLLNSLTEIGGVALHRIRLHEETVRQLKYLQSLHDIDRAISGSFDLYITLNIVLEQVTTQLQVDAASVLLFNAHLNTLEYKAGRGFRTRAAESARIRLGESLAGRVALERRTIQSAGEASVQENPQFAAFWAEEGFVSYYGVPLIAKGLVKGVLEVFHRGALAPEPQWLEFLQTLAGQAAIAVDNAQLFANLQRANTDLFVAYDATIEGWSRAMDLRDKETEGHTLRVSDLTLRLAKAIGLSDKDTAQIRRGALLHDIGKMGVPDGILLKPGKLTDEEWKIMRQHPQFAYDMLHPIQYLRTAIDIPYCHHEKWDGTGYPRGLKADEIPLAARLFAVVDVWDALTSDRPYRKAWTKAETQAHIREQSGIHFDPRVVDAFLQEFAD
jgi:PAS domain S-box-containing protein/putative nucleotidyltransferase with HDIG domain